jgi:D-tyrosyl-tRNA(Tyr) deacylase
MKVIVQRVLESKVIINNSTHAQIQKGYLLYVCFEREDSTQSLQKAVQKITDLRINEDENQKMNLDISQINGEILSISQFTLSWDGKKGNRPSFENSMEPLAAQALYDRFNQALMENGINTKTGIFGADMKIESINDGPVTFILNF